MVFYMLHFGIFASVIRSAHIEAQSQHASLFTPSVKPTPQSTPSLPVCNGILRGTSGVIASPEYPSNYPSNTNCKWQITVDFSKVILIEFMDFAVEEDSDCGYDKLIIQEKSGVKFKTTAKFCGTRKPGPFRTRSNVVQLVFTSDESENKRGFNLKWRGITNRFDCGITNFNSTMGAIQSPGFPNPYENSINCTYSIEVPQGYYIKITIAEINIEYSTGCSYDTLLIHEVKNSENAVLGKFCGTKPPSTDIVSTTNNILLTFTSDESTNGKGFNVTWTSTRLYTETGSRTCGRKYHGSTRIVGGTIASPGEFPWQVGLFWRNGIAKGKYFCGGALIQETWILTAAHCFVNGINASFYQVKLGDQNLRVVDGQEQTFNISTIIVHPHYNIVTYDNDVALVKIETTVNLTDFVNTICLPSDVSEPGIRCMIAGWGATMEHGRASNNLMKAAVPIIDRRTCARADVYGSKITGNMICAGYANGGIDTCQGDSGGPLHCQNKENPSSWEVQGIASWGRGCGRQLRYGVYTKVHNYVQWINCIMKSNELVLESQKGTDSIMVCDENSSVVNMTRTKKVQLTSHYASGANERLNVTASKFDNGSTPGLFLTPSSSNLYLEDQSSIQSSRYLTPGPSIITRIQTSTDGRSASFGVNQVFTGVWSSVSNNVVKETGAMWNSKIVSLSSTQTVTLSKSVKELSTMGSILVTVSRKESPNIPVGAPVSSVVSMSNGISPFSEAGRCDMFTKQAFMESRAKSSITMKPQILPSNVAKSTSAQQHGILVQTNKQYSMATGSSASTSMVVTESSMINLDIYHADSQSKTMAALSLQRATNTSIRIESSIEVMRNSNARTAMPNARSSSSINCSSALLLFVLSVLSM